MTTEPKKTITLDNSQNQKIQFREWVTERIGWLLFVVCIVSGLLGFLGPGPFSDRQKTSSDDQLSVEYYRLVRHEAPAELRIHCQPSTKDSDRLRLTLSREFTDKVAVERIIPKPYEEQIGNGVVQYDFRRSEMSGDGVVVFQYRNTGFGGMSYDVTLNDGPQVHISQFVFP